MEILYGIIVQARVIIWNTSEILLDLVPVIIFWYFGDTDIYIVRVRERLIGRVSGDEGERESVGKRGCEGERDREGRWCKVNGRKDGRDSSKHSGRQNIIQYGYTSFSPLICKQTTKHQYTQLVIQFNFL